MESISDDATTPGWVRTREQISGGPFSQIQPCSTADEADTFLLELDLARSSVTTREVLDNTLKHEMARFRELPTRLRVAFSVNRAQRHGLTNTLAVFPRLARVEKQTALTMELLRVASAEARVLKTIPPASEFTYQAPVVAPPSAAKTLTPAWMSRIKLRKDQRLPNDLGTTGHSYAEAGRNISGRLVEFLDSDAGSWPESERVRIGKLYTIEEHVEDGVSDTYPRMVSCRSFIGLARKVRESGWVMDDEVAGWFITAIAGRRKLRDWHDRLPIDDPRFKENSKHEAWLQTLIEVVVVLAGHQTPDLT